MLSDASIDDTILRRNGFLRRFASIIADFTSPQFHKGSRFSPDISDLYKNENKSSDRDDDFHATCSDYHRVGRLLDMRACTVIDEASQIPAIAFLFTKSKLEHLMKSSLEQWHGDI